MYAGQELSSSSESESESGSGSEGEFSNPESNNDSPGRREAEFRDLSWRLLVYQESEFREVDSIATNSFKQKSPFDLKFGNDDIRRKTNEQGKSAQDLRSTRCHRSVLEVFTHVVEAYSKPDLYTTLQSPKWGSRSGSPRPLWPRKRSETQCPPEDLRIKRVLKVELVLRSKHLRKVLKSMIKYYPSHAEEGFRRSVFISEPYAMLMHNYENIEAWICTHAMATGHGADEKDAKNLDKEVAHMKILRDFLRDKFENTVHPSLQHLAKDKPIISFDSLWVLFVPGEDIYGRIFNELGVFVIEKVEKDSEPLSPTYLHWRITCWNMVTNGHRIARSTDSYYISRFAGLREVLSLPVFPAKIWDAHDGGARRKRILERNRLHLDAIRAGGSQFHFDGKDVTTQRAVSILSTMYHALLTNRSIGGKLWSTTERAGTLDLTCSEYSLR